MRSKSDLTSLPTLSVLKSAATLGRGVPQDPPNPMHRDMSSKLTIVDLAGSERQSKTDVEDAKRLKEAERINMSLLILGRCLSACAEGSKGHIPIRESVLTKCVRGCWPGVIQAGFTWVAKAAFFPF